MGLFLDVKTLQKLNQAPPLNVVQKPKSRGGRRSWGPGWEGDRAGTPCPGACWKSSAVSPVPPMRMFQLFQLWKQSIKLHFICREPQKLSFCTLIHVQTKRSIFTLQCRVLHLSQGHTWGLEDI